jgi:hypothetical protein
VGLAGEESAADLVRRWKAEHLVIGLLEHAQRLNLRSKTASFVAAGQLHGSPAWTARSFALRLLGADEELPTVEDGLCVTEVIAAVHQAVETAAPVVLAQVASTRLTPAQ